MKYKTLKEIANITMGQSPDSTSYNSDGDGIPFFQGNADFGEVYPKTRVWCNDPKKYAYPNDILISVRAPIGALNYADSKCCIGRGLAAISIEDPTTRNYVYHLLKACQNDLNSKGTGSTFKAINKSVLEDVLVPMISIEEQNRCVFLMDHIEFIIRARKKQLDELDELIKARFVEMFGDPVSDTKNWGQKPLKEMLESIRYGTSTPPEFSDRGYAFIRATNIKNGRIVDADMKFIPQCEADRLEKCKLSGGEIIIVRSGVNAGDTCVVSSKYIGQYAGYDMILVLNDSLNPVFLNALINTTYMERIVKPMTRRAAQPHLNSEQTQSFPIICVPKELQDQFESFVKQVDKSKFAIQKSLEETQLLFDSLMQQYFG